VAILSITPSMTEVMTTSAKTPSIRSVRVNDERSLCAQSSTSPPLTISQLRATFAPSGRRFNGVTALKAGAGTDSARLLIPQRLHGREAARLPGREEGKDEAGNRRQPI